ncbi:hypothetical protein LEMLEM_LOCUS6497, partial [Lemmus lemmus]
PGRWVSLGTERREHLRFRTRHVGAVTSVGSRNTGLGSESSDQDSGKSRGTDHSRVQRNRDGESCLPSLNFPPPIPIHHNALVLLSSLPSSNSAAAQPSLLGCLLICKKGFHSP